MEKETVKVPVRGDIDDLIFGSAEPRPSER